MKKILIKLFPILGEEMPPEYLEKTNRVNRLCVLILNMGVFIGCVLALIVIEIIDHFLKK